MGNMLRIKLKLNFPNDNAYLIRILLFDRNRNLEPVQAKESLGHTKTAENHADHESQVTAAESLDQPEILAIVLMNSVSFILFCHSCSAVFVFQFL